MRCLNRHESSPHACRSNNSQGSFASILPFGPSSSPSRPLVSSPPSRPPPPPPPSLFPFSCPLPFSLFLIFLSSASCALYLFLSNRSDSSLLFFLGLSSSTTSFLSVEEAEMNRGTMRWKGCCFSEISLKLESLTLSGLAVPRMTTTADQELGRLSKLDCVRAEENVTRILNSTQQAEIDGEQSAGREHLRTTSLAFFVIALDSVSSCCRDGTSPRPIPLLARPSPSSFHPPLRPDRTILSASTCPPTSPTGIDLLLPKRHERAGR